MLNSYVKKVPMRILILVKSIRVLQHIWPRLAVKKAITLFFEPIRFELPKSEEKLRRRAKITYHKISSGEIAVLEWKSSDAAPYVLLMHGWGSRATHFKQFIERLLSQGFNVICPEAPAHGLSSGKRSDVLLFAESIHVAYQMAQPELWLCHSMGGSAAMFAIHKYNLKIKHLSVVATPSIAEEILAIFASRIGLKPDLISGMRQGIVDEYGENLKDYTAEIIIQKLNQNLPINLVYDHTDTDAPVNHGERLKELYPPAHLHVSDGLGHVKIIKELSTLDHCQKFWPEALFTAANQKKAF